MTRQVRLLAALILVTAIGLLWPAEIAAQRRPPAGGGGARTGHAVPRTYHSGGGYHSGGYHSSGSYYRPYYYRPYYYRPYYYSRYSYPYYYAPYYPSYFGFGFGIGFGFGWGSVGATYGYGYPYPYPYGYAAPYAYAQPYAGYGSGYTGPNTMQMQQPAPAPQASYPAQQTAPQSSTAENGSFGTLSLRVTPVDATILIDGQVWDRPQGQDRFSIDLVEGTHRVEVHQQGYGPYARTVQIHGGGTLTINVSLSTGGGGSQVPQLAVRRTIPLR
jgi:hypothetical protein